MSHCNIMSEMHPTRWGDPALAAPLPGGTRGLVDLVFATADRSAVVPAELPAATRPAEVIDALAAVVGAEHVHTDDETRRVRTRGKSTPDLLRARAGDLSDAPDAVVRPATHEDGAAGLASAVEHHVAVVPFGGGTCGTGGLAARRDGMAG